MNGTMIDRNKPNYRTLNMSIRSYAAFIGGQRLRQWEKQGCREGYSPLSRTHVFREDYTGLYILQ